MKAQHQTLLQLPLIALVLFAVVGCEGTKRDDTLEPVDTDMLRTNYGIGSQWYDYNLEGNHQLYPRDISWQYSTDTQAYTISVETYYHPESGESGYFTLSVSSGGGPTATLTTDESVKEAPVCVDLDAPATVSCQSEDLFELVLRTDRRPVPAAGFSVGNPSIYFRRGHGQSVVELRASGEGIPLPSPRDASSEPSPLDAFLHAPTNGHAIQLTADFQLVQWRVVKELPLTIESRCSAVLSKENKEQTTPFSDVSTNIIRIENIGKDIALVDLCPTDTEDSRGDDEQTQVANSVDSISSSQFSSALWPVNDSFDLFIHIRKTDGIADWILPAPDNAVETRISPWDSKEGTALPYEIWDDTF